MRGFTMCAMLSGLVLVTPFVAHGGAVTSQQCPPPSYGYAVSNSSQEEFLWEEAEHISYDECPEIWLAAGDIINESHIAATMYEVVDGILGFHFDDHESPHVYFYQFDALWNLPPPALPASEVAAVEIAKPEGPLAPPNPEVKEAFALPSWVAGKIGHAGNAELRKPTYLAVDTVDVLATAVAALEHLWTRGRLLIASEHPAERNGVGKYSVAVSQRLRTMLDNRESPPEIVSGGIEDATETDAVIRMYDIGYDIVEEREARVTVGLTTYVGGRPYLQVFSVTLSQDSQGWRATALRRTGQS